MSRTRKRPSYRCPEGHDCDWCGPKVARWRQEARARHVAEDPYVPPGVCWCCVDEPGPTAQDIEYEKREREYEAWIEEQELEEMARVE